MRREAGRRASRGSRFHPRVETGGACGSRFSERGDTGGARVETGDARVETGNARVETGGARVDAGDGRGSCVWTHPSPFYGGASDGDAALSAGDGRPCRFEMRP